jgi:pyruvate dehydrogenase phosphatase
MKIVFRKFLSNFNSRATCKLYKTLVCVQSKKYYSSIDNTVFSRRYLNIGGKTSSTLLLSPAEATQILRTNESTIDIETKSSIKYYDINYLGANSPPEDRYAQAKYLHSDIYLFGVFDGHGGYYCSDTITQRLYDYIAINFLTSKQLEDRLKWNTNSDPNKQSYPLWHAFSSPYPDLRSEKLREIHKQSLNLYTDELLKERIMEESIGNDIEINIEKILKASFLKLDQDVKVEAMPNPASGKLLDKETMDVAMSGSCACVALLNGSN